MLYSPVNIALFTFLVLIILVLTILNYRKTKRDRALKTKFDQLVGRTGIISQKLGKLSSDELILILEDKISRYEIENRNLRSETFHLNEVIKNLTLTNNHVSDYINKLNRNALNFMRTYSPTDKIELDKKSSLQDFELSFNHSIIRHNNFYKAIRALLKKTTTSSLNLDKFKLKRIENQAAIITAAGKLRNQLKIIDAFLHKHNTNLIQVLDKINGIKTGREKGVNDRVTPIYEQVRKTIDEIGDLRKNFHRNQAIEQTVKSLDSLSKIVDEYKFSNPDLAMVLTQHIGDSKLELIKFIDVKNPLLDKLAELEKTQKELLTALRKETSEILISVINCDLFDLKHLISNSVYRNENLFALVADMSAKTEMVNNLLLTDWNNLSTESLCVSTLKTQLNLIQEALLKLKFNTETHAARDTIDISGFRVNEKGEIII